MFIESTRRPLDRCSHQDVVRLTFRGQMDMAVADLAVCALAVAMSSNPEVVQVDLRGLTFLDVAGVNVLMRSHVLARNLGVHLELIVGSGVAYRLLQRLGGDALFDDPEEFTALGSLRERLGMG